MKEVKFRAVDKKTNSIRDVTELVWEKGKLIEVHFGTYESFGDTIPDWKKAEEVELLQFTGLKDKNGVIEIYEKYIIAKKDGKGNIVWMGVVEWSNEGAEYKIMLINSKEKYAWRSLGTGTKDVYPYGEVIGNIYENPELLEWQKS